MLTRKNIGLLCGCVVVLGLLALTIVRVLISVGFVCPVIAEIELDKTCRARIRACSTEQGYQRLTCELLTTRFARLGPMSIGIHDPKRGQCEFIVRRDTAGHIVGLFESQAPSVAHVLIDLRTGEVWPLRSPTDGLKDVETRGDHLLQQIQPTANEQLILRTNLTPDDFDRLGSAFVL